MRILVIGGAGYIASHLTDFLIDKGHEVVVVDNLAWGKHENVNPKAKFYEGDIITGLIELEVGAFYCGLESAYSTLPELMIGEKIEVVFHLAAVSRTPHAIENPILTYETNVLGSANVLEAARQAGVKKVVLASSNIVYAAQTPYKSSKLAMEMIARDYNDLYGLSTICLRFSNVYGAVDDIPLRQNEDNVLASLAKSKRAEGKIKITGDGEQTRNFTHVSDICEALYLASGISKNSDPRYVGRWFLGRNNVRGTEIDIMNSKLWSLNEVAKFYDCPIEYLPERKGDIKHLQMGIGPEKAKDLLGFEAKRELQDYIKVYTD